MSDNNGGGNAGGNSSVWWEVRHGSATNPRAPQLSSGAGIPPSGSIKIGASVQGHDESTLADIGRPDHPGKFRVRLRFRDSDLNALPAAEQAWIREKAVRIAQLDPASWFLLIDVPAIERKPDASGNWPEMPWEIHWEW
jgi:hypothetical protein